MLKPDYEYHVVASQNSILKSQRALWCAAKTPAGKLRAAGNRVTDQILLKPAFRASVLPQNSPDQQARVPKTQIFRFEPTLRIHYV
jgi:hypothetical protein